MTGLPSELQELADWLEKLKQEKDGGDTTSLDFEIMFAISRFEDSIHDSLLIYKSVELASEFKERFEELYKGACSPDARISSMVPWEAGRFARFCRLLAGAIEGEQRAEAQQASDVSAIGPRSLSAAGKIEHGGVPPAATPVADQPEAGDAAPIRRPADNAIAAWRLRDLEGLKSQGQIAKRMSQELGKKVNQGTVSRWLEQVDNYMLAGNVLPGLPAPISKPRTIDPSKLDMGERTDGRPPHQRQKRTPNSD